MTNNPTEEQRQTGNVAGITITAPARIHLGFLDLNGGLGRRFGSLGISIDGIATRLRAEIAASTEVVGPDSDRVLPIVERLTRKLKLETHFRVVIESVIPSHSGLGSGTQLALAVGTAVTRLAGLELSAADIGALAERGARSGIGVGSFTSGGVLLDGGRVDDGAPPPIISRLEFPASWRIFLILDNSQQGLFGDDETNSFGKLPVFPADTSAHLCRLVLIKALPAIIEEDLPAFSEAVTTLQQAMGDYFAPFQGGRYTSPAVAEVLIWLKSEGICGLGQSSWGPTGFAIVDSEQAANRLLNAAEQRWRNREDLCFLVCNGRNHGYEINIHEATSPVS